MKLEEVKFCKVCMSSNLRLEPLLTIDDVDTDLEKVVTAKVCEDCETIHFIENGNLAYQFIPRRENYKWVEMKTDYEVAKEVKHGNS